MSKQKKTRKWPKGTKVWYYCNIYPGAKIGKNVNIGSYCEIRDQTEIGDGTRLQAFVFIPEKVKIGKNCFIGPHVVFTNDKYPPSSKKSWQKTIVEDNVAIGANCTIICGVKIGKGALIGAGSVVTEDIPPAVVVYGVPARIKRKRY